MHSATSSRGRTWRRATRAVMRSTSLTPLSWSRSACHGAYRSACRATDVAGFNTVGLALGTDTHGKSPWLNEGGHTGPENKKPHRDDPVGLWRRREIFEAFSKAAYSPTAQGEQSGNASLELHKASRWWAAHVGNMWLKFFGIDCTGWEFARTSYSRSSR